MRSKVVVSAVLFCLAAAFSTLAFYSPVKSLPAEPVCNIRMTAASCQYLMSQYPAQLAAAKSPFWLYQSEAEIAEGFLLLASLSGLFALDTLRMQSALNRKIAISEAAKRVSFWVAVCGAIAFAGFCVLDIIGSMTPAVWPTIHLLIPTTRMFGVAGFSMFLLTALSLTLYKSEGGLIDAIKSAVLKFAAPSIFLLMLGLLIFDLHEMPLHVTYFTDWSLGGFYILSNWFILMIASFLTFVSFAGRGRRL